MKAVTAPMEAVDRATENDSSRSPKGRYVLKDVIVETLIIEEDRPDHIAKHNIIIDEVLEVLTGDYVYIAGRENRWLIIGKTARKVFLTIVIGERPEKNTYGLITARSARRQERSFYMEYITQGGGEEEDENKAS